MFKNKDEKEIDFKSLNEVIGVSKNILKLVYGLIIVIGFYAVTMLVKEWHITEFLGQVFGILAPLFIGFVIAWLLNPIVIWLMSKGVKRGLGASMVYSVLVLIIYIMISSLLPILAEQINEFVASIPATFDSLKIWVEGIFNGLPDNSSLNIETIKTQVFENIELVGANLTKSLPNTTVNMITSFVSALGIFIVGLVIGFYLLVSYSSFDETFIPFIPTKFRGDMSELAARINSSLRVFVKGLFLSATLIFLLSSLGFGIAGLKAPILFALFCGLTNIIPYIGPYIGGVPAIIVGFSQSTQIGIIVLLIIIAVQFFESNIFSPIVQSRNLKLHPVTIIVGLLVFGSLWGILGMLLATPIIAVSKTIYIFLNEKYNFVGFIK